jgi:pyrroloquinoline quinone biosynthesis protein B
MKIKLFTIVFLVMISNIGLEGQKQIDLPALITLGVAQDAGFPQINCQKTCCTNVRLNKSAKTNVSCLGLILENSYYLFDATPDIKEQIELVHNNFPHLRGKLPEGIFLTHAHIGHYTGLMDFGREATNAMNVKVYAMPRMAKFLRENGPWSQLVELKNIQLVEIGRQDPVSIGNQISVTSFLVPHRDEFSETVGYEIRSNEKRVVFIPDIDKWQKWKVSILDIVEEVDYAFIDATFYDISELPKRNMSEIPHPFVVETMDMLDTLPESLKNKVHFIHFNHSNPLIDEDSWQNKLVESKGFGVARQGSIIGL